MEDSSYSRQVPVPVIDDKVDQTFSWPSRGINIAVSCIPGNEGMPWLKAWLKVLGMSPAALPCANLITENNHFQAL